MSAFFDIIHQDPILSEPLRARGTSLGDGGYQVGLSRCSGRSAERSLPRHHPALLDRRGVDAGRYRLSPASSHSHEGPWAAIRTSASTSSRRTHGFTLRDLVSYEKKWNLANGEENRDGTGAQRTRGTAASEGETEDPKTTSSRYACQRPTLRHLAGRSDDSAAGDEMGKTEQRKQQRLLPGQRELDEEREGSLASPREVFAFRMRHRPPGAQASSRAERVTRSELKDIARFHPEGREMTLNRLAEQDGYSGSLQADALDWRDAMEPVIGPRSCSPQWRAAGGGVRAPWSRFGHALGAPYRHAQGRDVSMRASTRPARGVTLDQTDDGAERVPPRTRLMASFAGRAEKQRSLRLDDAVDVVDEETARSAVTL